MLKKIGSIILLICLLIPTNSVFAADSLSGLKTTTNNEETDYWKGKFDSFDEQLNNGNLEDLVGTSELYIKYTPKNENVDTKTATKDDFNTETFDKEGYKRELLGIMPRGIGAFEPNGTCSWLRLDLQVYETGTSGVYSAISFWEWKTNPLFRLTDLNGIYVSSEMAIGEITASNPKIAEFRYREANSNTWYVENPFVEVSQFGNGAAAASDIPGNSELFKHDSFMGMTMVPIEFSNIGSTSGRVYTNYQHTFIRFGDISFDDKGKPSLGLSKDLDEFSGSLRIVK